MKVFYKTDDGEYKEIKKIEETDLMSENEPYDPFDVNAWDDQVSISIKMNWWQRFKFRRTMRKIMREAKKK